MPFPYNGILRYTQLVAAKLHFLFGGKISSFSGMGVLSQQRHGRESLYTNVTSRAQDRDTLLSVEAKLLGSLGTTNVQSWSHWALPKFSDQVHTLEHPAQWTLGML
jgi:hypothetical protein